MLQKIAGQTNLMEIHAGKEVNGKLLSPTTKNAIQKTRDPEDTLKLVRNPQADGGKNPNDTNGGIYKKVKQTAMEGAINKAAALLNTMRHLGEDL